MSHPTPTAGSPALTPESVLERHPDVAWQRLGGELVLLHYRSKRLLGLNPTAARTWELLDGQRSLGAIGRVIAEETSVGEEQVTEDVLAFARTLAERELARAAGPGSAEAHRSPATGPSPSSWGRGS